MNQKVVLGVATLFPTIYCVCFLGVVVFGLVYAWDPPQGFIVALVALHIATMLLIIGLVIFYIRQALGNRELTAERRPVWVMALLFANIVSMPIYWYRYIVCADSTSRRIVPL